MEVGVDLVLEDASGDLANGGGERAFQVVEQQT